MNKLFKRVVKRSWGFTMIELLIVIAILGILAVAVLSAINPVEQINRGRDTGSRSDAEQLLSAIDRFNAFQGYYPWVVNPTDDSSLDDGANGPLPVDNTWVVGGSATAGDCPVLTRLSEGDTSTTDPCQASDELKVSFMQRITDAGYNPLYIYNQGGQGDSTYICFQPQSGAFKTEANNRCTSGLPSDIPQAVEDILCDTANSGEDPYICLP